VPYEGGNTVCQEGTAHALILLIVVFALLSSAVTILKKNVYFEEPFET
jgi:hypothetical protein